MNCKALKGIFLISTAFALMISGCKKESSLGDPSLMWVGSSPAPLSNPAYKVALETKIANKNGTYTWVWSVINTKPGNGIPGSGTAQDLVNWGITLGSCADINQIISGSTSADGLNWHNFDPEVKPDSELASISKPLLMFNKGTVKDQKSYYKLVVLRNFSINTEITSVYKSGPITGNGILTMSGFGCPTY